MYIYSVILVIKLFYNETNFYEAKLYWANCNVAPVELHKTSPRLHMNWSILASVMDTPFHHNLEIAGSNPLHC